MTALAQRVSAKRNFDCSRTARRGLDHVIAGHDHAVRAQDHPDPSLVPAAVVTVIVTTLGSATAAALASSSVAPAVLPAPDGGADTVTVAVLPA
jgi:hypothetical protein